MAFLRAGGTTSCFLSGNRKWLFNAVSKPAASACTAGDARALLSARVRGERGGSGQAPQQAAGPGEARGSVAHLLRPAAAPIQGHLWFGRAGELQFPLRPSAAGALQSRSHRNAPFEKQASPFLGRLFSPRLSPPSPVPFLATSRDRALKSHPAKRQPSSSSAAVTSFQQASGLWGKCLQISSLPAGRVLHS